MAIDYTQIKEHMDDGMKMSPEEIAAYEEYEQWLQEEVKRFTELGDQAALNQLWEDNK